MFIGLRSTRLARTHAGTAYGDAFAAEFDRIPPKSKEPRTERLPRRVVERHPVGGTFV